MSLSWHLRKHIAVSHAISVVELYSLATTEKNSVLNGEWL